jgi:CBS domain-containing protein
VKTCIWVVALGSGTSGGVLAPLLTIGAGLGTVLGPWLPGGSPELWALVCMASILGGTMRAPLTAVVFAFGLTHDVNAFLPTILGCVVAYGFTVIVMPRSILTEKIARRGRHVYREYGVDPLDRHFVDEVMTRSVLTIDGSMHAGNVLREYFGPEQLHRAYPVVLERKLIGMLDRTKLQAWLPDGLERPVSELLAGQPIEAFATPGDTCRMVASQLAAGGTERIPIVDSAASLHIVGIVSRSDLLKPSRLLHDEDVNRERNFDFLGRIDP